MIKTQNSKRSWDTKWIVFFLWGIIGLYFIVVSFLTIARHRNFYSLRYDLGNMEQVVYNTSEGKIFQFTDPEGVNTISRLKYHADFILILVAPIYRLFPYTETLLVLQTLVLALGAIAVFWLARDALASDKFGLVGAIFYLSYPALIRANLFDFHGVTFATTFLLFAFWYLYKKRYSWFFVFSVLAILCKEQIPVAIVLMTFWGMWQDKSFRKKGLIFAVLVGIYFLFTFFWLIPLFRGVEKHFVFKHFGSLRSGLGEGVGKLLLQLFMPLGFLSILAPIFLGFGIFDLGGKLISTNGAYKSIDFHYMAAIIPFFIIGFIFGLKKYIVFLEKKKVRQALGLVPVWVFMIISFCLWSPFTSNHLGLSIGDILTKRSEVDYINDIKKQIPNEAGVCATNNLGSQFGQRADFYMFPNNCAQADYILIWEGYWDMVSEETVEGEVSKIEASGGYEKIGDYGSFVGYRKIK